MLYGSDAPQTTPTTQKLWPEFALQLDENFGAYKIPITNPDGSKTDEVRGTNNVFLKLIYKPQALLGKKVGLMFNAAAWNRTADVFDKEHPDNKLRIFLGPIGYWNIFDNSNHRIQFLDSLNYFYGTDLGAPEAKDWKSHELGNFAQLSYTHKPTEISVDLHNWYVHGLEITLAKKNDASESGLIFGSTLSYKPFKNTDFSFLDNLTFYLRFREWGWQVVPKGKSADRTWWPELTCGLKTNFDFSIFE
ncbi:hypothetical protein KKA47_00685 [bacterium]|nr:hypothetical protein [bacterium]